MVKFSAKISDSKMGLVDGAIIPLMSNGKDVGNAIISIKEDGIYAEGEFANTEEGKVAAKKVWQNVLTSVSLRLNLSNSVINDNVLPETKIEKKEESHD